MTQAARRSGQQQPKQPEENQQRDSDTRAASPPRDTATSFYESLPLGSEAFMAPLAPAPEPRALTPRKVLLFCAFGACAGAVTGGLVLMWVLNRTPAPVDAPVALSAEEPRAREPSSIRTLASEASGSLEQAVARNEHDEAAATPASVPEPSPSPTPAAAAAPATDAAAGAPDLDRSQRSGRRKPQLLDKPSREQVISAMARVQSHVKACLPTGHGMATADVTVLGRTGRVTTAHISGQAGTVGSCIARAVRKAKFPKFASESMTIRYPMAH